MSEPDDRDEVWTVRQFEEVKPYRGEVILECIQGIERGRSIIVPERFLFDGLRVGDIITIHRGEPHGSPHHANRHNADEHKEE